MLRILLISSIILLALLCSCDEDPVFVPINDIYADISGNENYRFEGVLYPFAGDIGEYKYLSISSTDKTDDMEIWLVLQVYYRDYVQAGTFKIVRRQADYPNENVAIGHYEIRTSIDTIQYESYDGEITVIRYDAETVEGDFHFLAKSYQDTTKKISVDNGIMVRGCK
jgi:hypothetical protein